LFGLLRSKSIAAFMVCLLRFPAYRASAALAVRLTLIIRLFHATQTLG